MNRIYKTIRYLSIATLPLLIILTAIRLALLPAFVTYEYQRPSFPLDTYGFTASDRLKWSIYSIEYLMGNVSDEEFSTQKLVDGSRLFNVREFKHMQDVKGLTQTVLIIWQYLALLMITVVIIALVKKELVGLLLDYRKGIFTAFSLIFFILVFVALNFNLIFTKFHELFFEEDTWLFYLSDNLIRLYPLRFWQDIFIFIGGTSTLIGAALYLAPILIIKKKA